MNKVSFLFVLLLIISCNFVDKFKENKRDFETQIDTKQETSEQALRKRLSESQNKGLDFFKEVLRGSDDKLDRILSVGENYLNICKNYLQINTIILMLFFIVNIVMMIVIMLMIKKISRQLVVRAHVEQDKNRIFPK